VTHRRTLRLLIVGHAAIAAQLALFASWTPAHVAPIVCVLALLKAIAYGIYLRRLVVNVIVSVDRFHDFLGRMVGLMFVTMASFAADFFILYRADPSSITALEKTAPAIEQLFTCWYFSVLNFSFFGVADIIPVTIGSRFLLAVESLTSFLTLVFILSDFGALRDSVRRAGAAQYASAAKTP
jgi:hypothetical protein